MKREDAFRKPRYEIPKGLPRRKLVGPDIITGTVMSRTHNKVMLWDDPMGRELFLGRFKPDDLPYETILHVTVEKLKGKWTVTNVEHQD